MQGSPIRIGTRGSPLALAQAHEVRARLMAAHGGTDDDYPIIVIKTTGDLILDRPLAEVGGKGLFTKEIEEALISRAIDLAVHSMKDMQTALPPGLSIGAVLEREDVRDAFISLKHASLQALPHGATVGTSSLRREAQVRRARPDLKVVGFRGNVQTRLRKLEEGVADATFLACAGLNRLGMSAHITAPIATDTMLPAVAQGAVAIEIREDDDATRALIAPLNHERTALCVTAERAFLTKLEGSCRTPIAGLAELGDGGLTFRGMLLTPDGKDCREVAGSGGYGDAYQIGDDAGAKLLANAGPHFLAPHT
ncbi:MAG: hydroxymethylbilane synthase [Hyphomicrobiaceae bacterium]|nr:hydroxymethylbilane synthase [Hyphomicrobiaceae bacterium]